MRIPRGNTLLFLLLAAGVIWWLSKKGSAPAGGNAPTSPSDPGP